MRPHDLAIHRVEDGTPPPESAEGLVTRITHLGFEVRVDVELTEGGTCWVQLSRGSAADLGLEEKQRVWVRRTDAPVSDAVLA